MTKLLLQDFPSMTLLFYSSIIATITLIIYLTLAHKLTKLKIYTTKDFCHLTLLGFLGNFLYSALYYKGLTLISATDACILNYLWPIISVIFSCILLHEHITINKILAIILSFIGIILVTAKEFSLTIFANNNLFGSLLCISAAICYGAFNVLNKIKGKDQYINMTIYFFATSIFSGICTYLNQEITMPTTTQWLGILWLGILIDAVAVVLWAIALQRSEVSKLVNFAYLTPVISMIFSILLLHETINFYTIIGLILILSGCFIQASKIKHKPVLKTNHHN